MYENIKGISIKGKCFENITTLNFFDEETQRISLIFGRNGSGKSTISNALYKYSINDSSSELKCSLIPFNDGIVSTKSTDNNYGAKKRIFVFNEHYVNKNVGLKDDGLDTIVLFGNQNNVEAQIQQQNIALQTLATQLESLNKQKDIYNNKSSNIFKNIEKILKQNNGWADRERQIKGFKRNSSVSDKIIERISKVKPIKTLEELMQEYQIKFKKYKDISSNKNYPDIQCDIPFMTREKEQWIIELLDKKIKKPQELSVLERKIFKDLENGYQNYITVIYQQLKNGIDECPCCHQSISKEYGYLLLQSIETVLNEEFTTYKSDLENMRNSLNLIQFDSSPFYTLNSELCQQIDAIIKQCNLRIEIYLSSLNMRIENVYDRRLVYNINLTPYIVRLNVLLKKLQEELQQYNCMFNEVPKLQQELMNINDSIAYYQIILFYNEYCKNNNLIFNLTNVITETQVKRNNIQASIDDLEHRKNNTKISVELINEGLKYIFFSPNRLYLEESNGKYILKSKDKLVKPNNISCGERNILGLCYYFTEILEKQDIGCLYNQEMLLLIDDPISSFDMENRIGIQSYLKQQLLRILDGNKNSKVIILSHDISTIMDLIKSSIEISKNCKVKSDKYICQGILENLEIKTKIRIKTKNNQWKESKVNFDNFNEYTENIKKVYYYAIGNNDDVLECCIGNIMRKVLEAFSTFEYKKGIEEISTDKEIISVLGEKQEYFSNLMYRLVANNLSHSKYQIQMLNVDFYSIISPQEKVRTAKDVLCLIYGLNRNHLQAHLKNIHFNENENNNKNAIDIIQEWYQEIPSFSVIS